MNLFFLAKKAEISAETNRELLRAISNMRGMNLPLHIKSYFTKPFEGKTYAELDRIEADSNAIIQGLIDTGAIVPYMSESECFEELEKYTQWAFAQKCGEAGEKMPELTPFFDLLKSQRGAENAKVKHFLNIADFLATVPRNCIPANFIVWVEPKEYGNVCIAYSQFNNQYKYIAIYKNEK